MTDKFELTNDLESLIKKAEGETQILSQVRANPSIENVRLREQLAQIYGTRNPDGSVTPDRRLLEMLPSHLVEEQGARLSDSYKSLETGLGDNYKKARDHFVGALKELKPTYYVALLGQGIRPEKPSDDLKTVIKQLELADKIEQYVQAGHLDQAR